MTLNIRTLSTELQFRVENELNEIPSRIRDDLEHIRSWLKEQPHIHARSDEQWLIGFLRGCKYSLQRTKEKLDYFYTIRSRAWELFANRDPILSEIQTVLQARALLPLPVTEAQADSRIILARWSACDVEKISVLSVAKVFFMILDIMMNEDDNCMVSGIHIVVDFREFPLSYLLQLTPGLVKKLVLSIQNAYPVRIKGMHAMNTSQVLETVVNLAKTFMNQKLKDRVHVYSESNSHEMYKNIPLKLMPKEYGGDNDSIDDITAAWKEKLESYREWFLEDVKYCTDEKLRPGKSTTPDDVFGVEGTFRKLAVD